MNTIRTYAFLLAFCTFGMMSTAMPVTDEVQGAPGSFSLEQAIEYALANNAEVKNAHLQVKSSEMEVKSIVATGLPQVNANANFTHNVQIAAMVLPDFISPAVYGVLIQEGVLTPDKFKSGDPQVVQFGAPSSLTGSIGLNQLVFDGTYLLGLKAAKEYVGINQILANRTETQVRNAVKKAYYAVLIAHDNAELLQANLELAEKSLTETKALFNAGYAEQLDVDRLEMAVFNLKNQVQNIQYQEAILRNLLKVTMGYPVTSDIILTGNIGEAAASTKSDEAFDPKNRIEYELLRQNLLLDSLNIRRYQVGYYPSVTLNASHQQNSFATDAPFTELGKTWNPGTMYGVNVSVPIFDGFYKKSKIEQARLQYAMDKNTFDQTLQAMEMEYQQARVQVDMQTNNLEIQMKSRDLASAIYQQAKTKYQEGVGSSFELVQAQNELAMAEINYSEALYNLLIAQVDLQIALGKK